jgi:hemoglobin
MEQGKIPAPNADGSAFRQLLDGPLDGVEPTDRRAELARMVREQTGLDEAVLERVVRRFYARTLQDPLIGPVFSAHVDDWEVHYQKMVDFWASVGLLAGRYHRNALAAHRPFALVPEQFDRWLTLFDATLREECSPHGADHLGGVARRIAGSLAARLCTDAAQAQ